MRLHKAIFALSLSLSLSATETNKQHSAFYPQEVLQKIRTNLKHDPNGKKFLSTVITNAAYWHTKTDEQIRDLVFSPGITRSWMVWSDGYCPSCKKPVRMYDWKIDAQKHPWKLTCPNCNEVFPKNDFHAYYKSGLDEKGWFNQKRANRALLFNTDHPDASDPLHTFGVDDGEGYIGGDLTNIMGGTGVSPVPAAASATETHRWRFIGTYEIYGQFKQLILTGAKNLACAYVKNVTRLALHEALTNSISDSDVALCVDLNSGERDFIIVADSQKGHDRGFSAANTWISFTGSFCLARVDQHDKLKYVVLCHGSKLLYHEQRITVNADQQLVEVDVAKRSVLRGDPNTVHFSWLDL